MKRDLEYFNVFLNNPVSLSTREFNKKVSEWVDFIKANPKKYGMRGRGWKQAWERIGDDVERRAIIREEFEELSFLLDEVRDFDDAEQIKINLRWLEFMKKYQREFEFTDETIAESEAKFNVYHESVRKARIAEIDLKIAKAKAEVSLDKFANSMFEASEQQGKPVMIPAYKVPKRGQDN